MADVFDYGSLPPNVQDVLRKYRILRPIKQPDKSYAEGWAQSNIDSNIGSANGQPLGPGPLLDPSVVSRLLDADKTPNKDWFDWMMFQCGGGKEGVKRAELVFAKSQALFMEEGVKGYTDKVTGVRHPPKPKAQVEAEWKKWAPKIKDSLVVSDQDLHAPPRGAFGYYRNWPGKDRIYERVATSVREFLKLIPKAKQMNSFLKSEGEEEKMISFNPKAYDDVIDVDKAIRQIKQFHASKHAREDIQSQTVYDDDYLTVIVPLTYAAAVRFGHDAWSWANRSTFNNVLTTGNTHNNAWKQATGGYNKSVFVYIHFNYPMPPWVVYSDGKFRYHSIDSLALAIPVDALKSFNPDTVKMHDNENNQNITLGDLKQSIRDEPQRVYDPGEEEHPVHSGRPVYNAEEAEEFIRHIDAALNALKDWGRSFDPNQIVSDFMPNT